MDAVLHWIANGLAAVFFIACLVAWWEHLSRNSRCPPEEISAPRAPVKIDIALDDLPVARGDLGERHSTLAGAMTRMSGLAPKSNWIETAPMVLAPRTEAPTAPTSTQV